MFIFKVFFVLFFADLAFAGIVDHVGTSFEHEFGAGATSKGGPGYVYHEPLRGWFKTHTEPTDYQDAWVTCHVEDALLAAEWNVDFKAAINKIISTFGFKSKLKPVLYSGDQEKFSDGMYRYVNGEPTFTLGPNHKQTVGPNGLERFEHCNGIYENGTTGEVDCEQRLPFICFKPKPLACGEKDLGYNIDKRTGQCYKFNTLQVNWTEAYKACRKEGADLAVVNSDTEAQVLKELFPSTGSNYASVGFFFWKPSSSWLTIYGQTIQQAGFAKWHLGEPTSGAYRGFLYRDGKFYSGHVARTGPFICEKHPALQQSH